MEETKSSGRPVAGTETTVVSEEAEREKSIHAMKAMGAKQCPHCKTYSLKDEACNWVCCGLISVEGKDRFVVGHGCGRQWCFQCAKKLCGPLFDMETGAPIPNSCDHTQTCCPDDGAHCEGGHNSHCPPRFRS